MIFFNIYNYIIKKYNLYSNSYIYEFISKYIKMHYIIVSYNTLFYSYIYKLWIIIYMFENPDTNIISNDYLIHYIYWKLIELEKFNRVKEHIYNIEIVKYTIQLS